MSLKFAFAQLLLLAFVFCVLPHDATAQSAPEPIVNYSCDRVASQVNSFSITAQIPPDAVDCSPGAAFEANSQALIDSVNSAFLVAMKKWYPKPLGSFYMQTGASNCMAYEHVHYRTLVLFFRSGTCPALSQ